MSSASLDLRPAETHGTDYVERARELAPLLADAADEIEAQRELPERVVEALIAGGFFRLLLPRSSDRARRPRRSSCAVPGCQSSRRCR